MMSNNNIEMERRTTSSVDVNHDAVAPEAILGSLQTVISDVDLFLSNWCERFDRDIRPDQPSVAPDEPLQVCIEELKVERSNWEAKRKCEARQLEEMANQLTEAWLRLEAEQRSFLQMKEMHLSPHARQPSSDSVAGGAGESPVLDHRVAFESNSVSRAEPPKKTNRVPTRPGAVSKSQNSIRQFQQLKREIESSRPGSGQP
jgi:hypothetical protein